MSEEKSSDQDKKVHSANSWETADLGDEERNKKFLRLMGASKKEHHGKIVIGEKEKTSDHGRAKDTTEHINQELEEQYKHSLDHKITRKHHIGLGYSEPQQSTEGEKPREDNQRKEGENSGKGEDKSKEEFKPDEKGDNQEESSEKSDRKRDSSDQKQQQPETKKPKIMMNFVKASD